MAWGLWWLVREAFGVGLVGVVENGLASGDDGFGLPIVDGGGGHKPDAGVVVLVVVVVNEVVEPSAGVFDAGETVFWVGVVVFDGFELGFGIGVVVGGSRSAKATSRCRVGPGALPQCLMSLLCHGRRGAGRG